jgi:dipeptidyl aminopeptidase/acylaminoacyl peptidase
MIERNVERMCWAAGLVAVFLFVQQTDAQSSERPAAEVSLKQLQKLEESIRFGQEMTVRIADGQFLFQQLADLAEVDFVRYTGPASRVVKNPTAQGAGNPVVINAYTFIPRKRTAGAKIPLLIYVHGGVHGHVDGYAAHFLRELLAQGYAVVAPEYRGSSGFGKEFWELIDYGGLEIEDVFAAKQFMLENHEILDPQRVGILGWSHGGLITLMNLFNHPKEFRVGYAGVPVSDLVARMGYKNQAYRDLYSAPYHIGKTAEENVNEYRRRSPAWNAEKLQTPLLIHTNTNDEDVNVLEVEHLIGALKAAGKKFEHKIYQNAPGGHQFERLDTKLAKEARAEVYRFLAPHLNPPNPPR